MPITKATQNVISPSIVTTDTMQSISGSKTFNSDLNINSLKIGRGLGNNATNSIIGNNCFNSNSTGSGNVGIGFTCLNFNSTGNNNTAIGTYSLSVTTGNNNTAVGFSSGDGINQSSNNVSVGYNSYPSTGMLSGTTKGGNTAVGANSLTIGQTFNTVIGDTNHTAVGKDSLNLSTLSPSTNINNCTGIGFNAQVTGANQLQLGNSSVTTYSYGAVQDRSDVRDKSDIRNTELGLDFISALRPVDYKWDMREDYRLEQPITVLKPIEPNENDSEDDKNKYKEQLDQYNEYKIKFDKWTEDCKLSNITHDGSKKRNRFHHGLIAQEVKSVLDSKGIDFGGFQNHSINGGDDVLSIGYIELIAPMIKAIQELKNEIDILKNK